MRWVTWFTLSVLGLALLVDVAQATYDPSVLLGTAVGIGAVVLARRHLTTRAVDVRPVTLVLVLAAGMGVVVGLNGAWSAAEVWGLVALAGTVAAHERIHPVRLLLPLAMLVIAAPFGVAGLDQLWLPILIALASTIAVTISIGVGLMSRTADERLRERERLVRAQVRGDLAADLHDLVAHEVAGMVVVAQSLAFTSTHDDTRSGLDVIERAGLRALEEIRRMVSVTQDPERGASVGVDTIAGLADMAEHFAATSAGRVQVAVHTGEIDPAVAATLRRVLAEALTNVRRHGGEHAEVEVELSCTDTAAHLRVHNTVAAGRALGRGAGTGLDTMHERARAVGGHLVAGPEDSGRWGLHLTVPLVPVPGPAPHGSAR